MAHATTYTTDMLDGLTLIHQGKVRDSFANVGRYHAWHGEKLCHSPKNYWFATKIFVFSTLRSVT
jgi:hypothetical protein